MTKKIKKVKQWNGKEWLEFELNGVDLVQEKGNRTDVTMSQAAITAELDKLKALIEYEPIVINSFTGGKSVEIGSTVNSVSLGWSLNKDATIQTIDGVAIDTKLRSFIYENLNLKNNKTYTLKVVDEKDASATKTTTISFLNKIYWGVGSKENGFIGEDIKNLSNSALASGKSVTKDFNVNNQYIYFAYPTRFGVGSFSVGGFGGGFEPAETVSFTNNSGYTENYYVYRSTNLLSGKVTVVLK